MAKPSIHNVPEDVLEAAVVQLSTRVPVRLRHRLTEYLQFMEEHPARRPEHTYDWPDTIQGVVEEALHLWLSMHSIEHRQGIRPEPPKPKDPARFQSIKPKQ